MRHGQKITLKISNIATNSIKTLKNGSYKKKSKEQTKQLFERDYGNT